MFWLERRPVPRSNSRGKTKAMETLNQEGGDEMTVEMKGWGVRLASITVLGLGLVAGSAGVFGMSQAEAASPEQYRCGEAIQYEMPAFSSSGPAMPGDLVEVTSGDQAFERMLIPCGDYTLCGEFPDSARQFPVPMAIWNGTENCGSGEIGLP